MDELDRLYEELAKELSGYISVKTIGKKKRYYLQKKERGHVVSAYIKRNDLPTVRIAIKRRKRLTQTIQTLEKKYYQPLAKLTPAAKALNGSLLLGDQVVAIFKNGDLQWIDEARAPLMVKRTHQIEGWLASRAIDQHRPNSRLLKKALRIEETGESELALRAHGATITDTYWFRPAHSKLTYKDVAFKADFFADIALSGNPASLGRKPALSPELTAIGSYEKCWKLENGEWWMYKKENDFERFSECFISELGTALGFAMAEYHLSGPYIKTRNFAKDVNYEPLSGLLGNDDSYRSVFLTLDLLGGEFSRDYLKLLYFDALVFNVDRHNENCGILRDRKSGALLRLAPNFDNNIALISRGYLPASSKAQEMMIRGLKDFLMSCPRAKQLYSRIAWPALSEEILDHCFKAVPLPIDESRVKTMLYNAEYLLQRLSD